MKKRLAADLAGFVIRSRAQRLVGYFDERHGGSRQSAIFAIDQPQLPLELEILDRNESEPPCLDIVLSKSGADDRRTKSSSDKLLDQSDAAKLHRNAKGVAIGIEHPLEGLPRRSCFGEDERHFGDLRKGYDFLARQRMVRLNHELQLVAKDRNDTQARALDREGNDSDIHGAQLDLLDDFAAEVAVHAYAYGRVLIVKALEDLRQNVKKGRLVRTNRQHAARLLGSMGERIAGFVMQTKQGLRILQQNLSSGRESNGLARSVEEALLIIFFELANLRADCRLRSEHFRGCARKVAFLRHFDKSFQMIQVHAAPMNRANLLPF